MDVSWSKRIVVAIAIVLTHMSNYVQQRSFLCQSVKLIKLRRMPLCLLGELQWHHGLLVRSAGEELLHSGRRGILQRESETLSFNFGNLVLIE